MQQGTGAAFPCTGDCGRDRKGIVEHLMDTLGIKNAEYDTKKDIPWMHPGRTASITIDGEPMTRATLYEASGSTDGYIGGAIYVPEGGANVRIAWRAQAVSSSGSGGVFRLAVGNYEVYLPSNQSARYYSIGWLDGGRHSFEISPYSGTSGTYVYVLQFVS